MPQQYERRVDGERYGYNRQGTAGRQQERSQARGGTGGGQLPGTREQDAPRSEETRQVWREIGKILDQGADPQGTLLIESAKMMGMHLNKNNVSTAQIRKVFHNVKNYSFDNEGVYGLNMLRAKLAYVAGRHKEAGDLQLVLDEGLKKIGDDKTKFKRFQDFFEAIVAFHKKYRGSE
jgi:CRISPR-associated protein Csm2